jgi:hypothetical protein
MNEAENDTPGLVRLSDGLGAASEARMLEKTFAKKLAKAGWHTYRDEETGRVVTNAYEDERMKLQKICGLTCEVVSPPPADNVCAKIGPRL